MQICKVFFLSLVPSIVAVQRVAADELSRSIASEASLSTFQTLFPRVAISISLNFPVERS